MVREDCLEGVRALNLRRMGSLALRRCLCVSKYGVSC